MPRSPLAVFALLAAPSIGLAQTADYTVIDAPRALVGGEFGACVKLLDFTGEGYLDLAVSAPGEGAVYVFFGRFDLERYVRLEPAGFGSSDTVGRSLAATDLDGFPGDELIVGVPDAMVGDSDSGAVVVYSWASLRDPKVLTSEVGHEGALFGTSLETGDFDGDGLFDIVVGAPGASVSDGGSPVTGGRVHFFDGESLDERLLENPNPSANSNYGHDLALGDLDGDGQDDLYISALGNENEQGLQDAGQVYALLGPFGMNSTPRYQVFEDPTPAIEDPINLRWGMSIDAREGWLAVGSPRKDWAGETDAGAGTLFHGSSRTVLQDNPAPVSQDLLGYRTRLVDWVGDSRPDAVFVALGGREMIVYDAGDLNDVTVFDAPPDAADHWAQGMDYGQVVSGGKEEIVLGGPNWEPVTDPQSTNIGRVVIVEIR